MKNNLTSYLGISSGIHIAVLLVMLIIATVQVASNDEGSEQKLSMPEVVKQPQAPKPPLVQAVMIDQKQVMQHIAQIKQERQQKAKNEQRRRSALEQELLRMKTKSEQERKQLAQLKQRSSKRLNELELAEKKLQEVKQTEQTLKHQAEQDIQKQKRELLQIKQEKAKLLEQQKQEQAAIAKQAVVEKNIQDALKREQQQALKKKNQQTKDEIDRFKVMIQSKIERNLTVQEDMRGKKCVIHLDLAEDGFVINVKRVSGNMVLCRQAEAAVHKSKTLPVSSDPNVYQNMKSINLIVQPNFN
jgi:colicin import membrane protein